MGKISKKYIGDDQVGSVQIELENALSLRAKTQDGLSSVDLLEYSSSDLLVVQQDLNMLADKDIVSLTALGSNFNIQTVNGANIVVEPSAVTGADNGGEIYLKGGDSASGVGGTIFLWPGQDTAGLKSSVQVDAGSLVLQSSCNIHMFGTSGQNLLIYESFDYASSYGIKSNNYDLVMYTNNQSAAATDSKQVSLRTGDSTTSGNTGAINLISGDATDGNSGNINFTTGAGTGVRGDIVGSSFTSEFACSAFSVKPHSGGDTAFNVYDNSFNDSVTILKVSSDFALRSSLPFYVKTNDLNDGATATKAIYLQSGSMFDVSSSQNTGAVSIASGLSLGSGDTGNVSILSGDNVGTGDSGGISLTTGASVTGVRGSITLDALEVQCSAMQFKNAADPTLAQDLATKAYVDSQISAGTTCDKQSITLSAGDISAQYVDLNEQFVPESLFVGVGQRVNLYETLDYTLSIVSGVTRLTFAGPSATGGAEALVDGDILYIQGIIDLSP